MVHVLSVTFLSVLVVHQSMSVLSITMVHALLARFPTLLLLPALTVVPLLDVLTVHLLVCVRHVQVTCCWRWVVDPVVHVLLTVQSALPLLSV